MDQPQRRQLLGPAFPDDTGAVPARLAAALAAYAAGEATFAAVLAELRVTRVLVPVVAVLGEAEVDDAGLRRDKSSDMAAVLLTGPGGRLGLLAFTGTEPLAAWEPDARPVPVPAPLAARSALQEGAAALVVDVAGPVRLVVEGVDLQGLAHGWELARVGAETVWVRPAPRDTGGDSRPDGAVG